MEKKRTKKAIKGLSRNTGVRAGAGASRESGRKKRLADALRRNLGKRRNQARRRGES